MFQDLILVYWTGDDKDRDHSKLFWDFIAKIEKNKYYEYGRTWGSIDPVCYVVDTVDFIKEDVTKWKNRTRGVDQWGKQTVYFGFQGPRLGWEMPEFQEVLNIVNSLPGIWDLKVEWLPDNWFDHPGLVPTLTSPENALEWLEQQLINDKEVENEQREAAEKAFREGHCA